MRPAEARVVRQLDHRSPERARRVERSPADGRPEPARRFERTPERRTIVIAGQPVPAARRRRSPTQAQIAARPDRVALWAFLLGLFMILVAAATAHAAPL